MADVIMPKLGPNMTEGTLVEWRKSVGDVVGIGDVLAVIETDKTSVELEASAAGVLQELKVAPGTVVEVGAAIAVLGDGSSRNSVSQTDQTVRESRVRASPRARQLATDLNVNLSALRGTGPDGLVTGEDVMRHSVTSHESAADMQSSNSRPLSQIRRAIAARTSTSHATIPPISVSRDIPIDNSLGVRERLAAEGIDISINDLVLRAVVLAIQQHPRLNAWFIADAITVHRDINVAFAVEVPDGLIAPTIASSQNLTLYELAGATRDLVNRARSGNLRAAELRDSTITVSNLGMLGVTQFQAIINPPEVAIVAVGAVRTKPEYLGNQWVPRKVMTVTVSADHRAVDGADVGRFLATLSHVLETAVLD